MAGLLGVLDRQEQLSSFLPVAGPVSGIPSFCISCYSAYHSLFLFPWLPDPSQASQCQAGVVGGRPIKHVAGLFPMAAVTVAHTYLLLPFLYTQR